LFHFDKKQFSHTQSAVTEIKGHLQLKCSTAEWHIKNTSVCPTYSSHASWRTHSWNM